MKTRFGLMIVGTALGLSRISYARCPENCDDSGNTALGNLALWDGAGSYNVAIGYDALEVTNGYGNTGVGAFVLDAEESAGDYNTAIGFSALSVNFGGNNNTATGAYALWFNESGSNNTGSGYHALYGYSSSGSNNTASGANALQANTAGNNNSAHGVDALHSNTTGSYNTASGQGSLYRGTTASNNTAVGINALSNTTTGGNNIALGDSAGINLTTGTFNIDIGNKGVAGETGTIRIGKKPQNTATYIAGISGATVAGGVGVIIDTAGHLGTVVSSERFKDQIKPMDNASEAILALQPVTFRYKPDVDPEGIPQFGLVAEQVEKVDPDLVARDDEGKPYTVRYEAVNAMLLNEFLKEHRKVEEQSGKQQKLEATVAQQQKEIRDLTTVLKVQAAQIQKVSDQLKVQALTPRVVANN